MRFTDLGFFFILLPAAAALYYCCPAKVKPAALFFISAAFYCLAEPEHIWLFAALTPDFIFCSRIGGIEAPRRDLFRRLLVIKNIIIMLLFGIVLPMSARTLAPVGLMIVCISATEFVILRSREGLRPCSFFEAAASITFFGRIYYGPCGGVFKLITQLRRVSPSISSIARGVMYIVSATAKREILAEQFFALFRTISHMSVSQYSSALGWLCALCGGLGIYFTFSACSDIARGIACVFSLSLPRTLYFPFQARGLRDYIYRLNMPLEDSLNRILFPGSKRESGSHQNYLVSFMLPPALALLFSPSGGFLLWSLYFSALILLDWLLLRRIPSPVAVLSRILTFIITLPSYILLLPVPLYDRIRMLFSLIPVGGVPLYNNDVIYLLTSNAALLVIGLLFCTSIVDALSRATEKQLPRFWWAVSTAVHAGLLLLTVSFLMWNVR